MPINDIYQLNVNHLIAGKETSNVFYYRQSTPAATVPDEVARELCLDFFANVWASSWQSIISGDVALVSLWSRRLWPVLESGATVLYANEVGSQSGDALPNGSAVLISTSSTNATRNFKRRSYISGLPEAHSANSKITTAAQLDWNMLAFKLVTTELESIGPPVNTFVSAAFSKSLALEAGPQPWRDLTSFRLTPFLRSQRQRNPGAR